MTQASQDVEARAWASIDGSYRYALGRKVESDGDGRVLFVMLNPSTADATQDDPTIRKCLGFAGRWGYARLEVVNLFGWRATNPKELERVADPVGPRNDACIHDCIWRADAVVLAWGQSFPRKLVHRTREVYALIRATGAATWCLGTTNAGQPKHPLFLPYTTPKVPFTPSWGGGGGSTRATGTDSQALESAEALHSSELVARGGGAQHG